MKVSRGPAFMLVLLLGACAASRQEPPPAAVAARVVPAQKSAASNPQTVELDRQAKRLGYRAKIQNGDRMYCQYSEFIGSRISRTQCLTPESMAEFARSQEEIQNRFSQRNGQLCPSCIQKD